MYNLIWTYFLQNRSQWQQHMKEFVIILYCEIADSFEGDASKVSEVVTASCNWSHRHMFHYYMPRFTNTVS